MKNTLIKLVLALLLAFPGLTAAADTLTNGAYVIFSTRTITQATNNPRINIAFAASFTNGLFVGSNIITAKPIPIQPSNGVSTNWLTSAYYKVTIEGDPYTFLMGVPADGGTYNAISLITNTPSALPGFGLLYPGTYITITTNTTNGFISYTINSTGGGGGGSPIAAGTNIVITTSGTTNIISAVVTNTAGTVILTNNGVNLTNLNFYTNYVTATNVFDNGSGPMDVVASALPILPTNQFYYVKFNSTNSNGEYVGCVNGGVPTAINMITGGGGAYASGMFSLYGVTQPVYIYNIDNPPTPGTAVTAQVYAVQTNIGYFANSNSFVQDAALSGNVQLLSNPLQEFAGSNTARGHALWSSNSQSGSTLNLISAGNHGYADINFLTGGTYPNTSGNVLRFAVGVGLTGTNQFPYNNPYWEMYDGSPMDFVRYGTGVITRVNPTNNSLEIFNGTTADGDYSKVFWQGNASNKTVSLFGTETISNADNTTQTPLSIIGKTNGFYQVFIQNLSGGAAASGDLVIANDKGSVTATTNYVNLGINGSGYTNTNIWGNFNDSYLFAATNSTNLLFGSETTNGHILFIVGGPTLTNKVADFSPTNFTIATSISTPSNLAFLQYTNAFTITSPANANVTNLADFDIWVKTTNGTQGAAIWRYLGDSQKTVFNDTNQNMIFGGSPGLFQIGNGAGSTILKFYSNGIVTDNGNSNIVDFINRNLIGTNGQPILIWGSNLIASVNGGLSVSNALAAQSLTVTNNSTLKGAVAFQYPAASGYGISASGKISLDGNDITTDGNGNMNFNAGGNITTVGDVLSSLAGSLSNVNYGSATNNGILIPSTDNFVFALNQTNAGAYTNKAWTLTNLVVQNITINGTQTGGSAGTNNINWWSASNYWSAATNYFTNVVLAGRYVANTNFLSVGPGAITTVQFGSADNNGLWLPSLDNLVFALNSTNAGAYTNKAWVLTNLVVQNLTINGTQTGGNGLITNVANVWSASNQWTAQSNTFVSGLNMGSFNVTTNGLIRGALTVTSNSVFSANIQSGSISNLGAITTASIAVTNAATSLTATVTNNATVGSLQVNTNALINATLFDLNETVTNTLTAGNIAVNTNATFAAFTVTNQATLNGVVTGTGSISNNLVTNALIYDGVLAPNATVPTISATNAAQFTALPTITGNDRRMSISFTMQGSPVPATNLMTVSYATARPQADFLGVIVPLNNTAAALAPVSRLYVTNLTTANFQIWCGSAPAANGVYQIGVIMVQ